MRILANENFPSEAVEALRARGHDVFWVRTDSPGSPDSKVVDRAASDGRLLITFDKDFGELAFRRGLFSPAGIILFRIKASSPEHVAQVAVAVLEERSDWAGHFSVIEEGRVRMSPLPASPRSPFRPGEGPQT
jgi:predicted nuclease of predicted toxin-antitoxin system